MKTPIHSNSIIRGLERQRYQSSQQLRQAQILLIVSIIGAVLLFVVYQQNMLSSYPGWMIMTLWLMPLAGFIFGIYRWIVIHSDFEKNIKTKAIQAVFQNEGLDWDFSLKGRISKNVFKDTSLFSLNPTTYRGRHLVTGTFENIPLELSYVNCHRGGGKSKRRIFQGTLLRFRMPRDIAGTTVVLPDTAQRVFGKSLGKKMQDLNSHKGLKLVYFEESEGFEERFVVYSHSEHTARKLLNTQSLQRLIQLDQHFSSRLHLAFQREWTSAAITKMNPFRVSINNSFTDANTWREIAIGIQRIKDLIAFLKQFEKS